MKNGIVRALPLAGLAPIGLSLLNYAVSGLSSLWEKTKTPAENNMDVALRLPLFGVPMLISGVAELFFVIVGAWAFAYRHVFPGS